MRVRCIVRYDGTNYHGFQKQSNSITIQELIENSLEKICKRRVIITMSSRTDTGVHANNQVIHFDVEPIISGELFSRAINTYLPKDIRIISSEEVSKEFHARFGVKNKTYKYYISKSFMPCTHLYSKLIEKKLDVDLMNKEAAKLVGIHNFKSFTSKTKYDNYEREILESYFTETENQIIFTIKGKGFLRYMVRNLVGTLIEIGLGEKQDILNIIKKQDRTFAGLSADAKGLVLEDIEF